MKGFEEAYNEYYRVLSIIITPDGYRFPKNFWKKDYKKFTANSIFLMTHYKRKLKKEASIIDDQSRDFLEELKKRKKKKEAEPLEIAINKYDDNFHYPENYGVKMLELR